MRGYEWPIVGGKLVFGFLGKGSCIGLAGCNHERLLALRAMKGEWFKGQFVCVVLFFRMRFIWW